MDYQFMYINQLKGEGLPSGVLDTPEKVMQASQELRDTLAPVFENLRISKLRMLESAMDIVLD